MQKRMRQYLGIFCAIAVYYIIHEGAHLVMALCFGVFRKIYFLGLGIQLDIFAERITDSQLGFFCLVGSAATLITGWVLVLLANRICTAKSRVLKTVMWYVTLGLLLVDPVYLSILCGFFGGGDMNGIRLLIPEIVARATFGLLSIVHGVVIWKILLPKYTQSFSKG